MLICLTLISCETIQKSTVNGGAGANELLIDGFARHIEKEPDGKNYFFEVSKLSSDPNAGKVFSLVKDDASNVLSRTEILAYDDINNFVIVDILTNSDNSDRISYTTYSDSSGSATGADIDDDTGTDTGASADVFDSAETIPVGHFEGSPNSYMKRRLFNSFDRDFDFGKTKEYEFKVLAKGKKRFSGQQRFGDNNLISGDRYGNLLFGTRAKDKIRSRRGDDTIVGGNGNDVIKAGRGKTSLMGKVE